MGSPRMTPTVKCCTWIGATAGANRCMQSGCGNYVPAANAGMALVWSAYWTKPPTAWILFPLYFPFRTMAACLSFGPMTAMSAYTRLPGCATKAARRSSCRPAVLGVENWRDASAHCGRRISAAYSMLSPCPAPSPTPIRRRRCPCMWICRPGSNNPAFNFCIVLQM